MVKKSYFIVGLVLVILIIVVFFSINTFLLNSVEGECKIISENPGDKKVDIVFLSENVGKNKAEEYSNYLLASEPFSEHKEKFNFYSAGEVDGCKIVQGNVLLCYSKEMVKQSSLCKNDYIVVLSDRDRNIRSSSYINVLSLNVNHPNNVLLHEFAHAFSRLADEYVPSVIPRGAENCQQDCEDFDVEGCYKGCSKDSYYRSSEKSIMKTLTTNNFEELNTKIIEEDLSYYE